MKRSYATPLLVVHGDFAALTKSLQGGPGFDSTPYANPFHKCGNDTGEHDLDPACRS